MSSSTTVTVINDEEDKENVSCNQQHNATPAVVFIIIAPYLCGKKHLLKELGGSTYNIVEQTYINDRAICTFDIPINALLRSFGFVLDDKDYDSLLSKKLNDTSISERIRTRKGISDEMIMMIMLTYIPLAKGYVLQNRISDILKYLQATLDSYVYNTLVDVVNEMKDDAPVMQCSSVTILLDDMVDTYDKATIASLKHLISNSNSNSNHSMAYDAIAWYSGESSYNTYCKAIKAASAVTSFSTSRHIKLLTWGNEIPVVDLKTLIKRNVRKFLTTGMYVDSSSIYNSIKKCEKLLKHVDDGNNMFVELDTNKYNYNYSAVMKSDRDSIMTIASTAPDAGNDIIDKGKQLVNNYSTSNSDEIFAWIIDALTVNTCSSIISPLIHQCRSVLCSHTVGYDMKKWDSCYLHLLRCYVLKACPLASCARVAKDLMVKDLNNTFPYDGTAGHVDYLMHLCSEALTMVAANDSNRLFAFLDGKDCDIVYDTKKSILPPSSFIHYTSEVPPNWSLLHHASSTYSRIEPALLTGLLKRGLSVNTTDDFGNNALHIACSTLHYENISTLIDLCCPISHLNSKRYSPLDVLLQSLKLSQRTSWSKHISSEQLLNIVRRLLIQPTHIWENDTFMHAVLYTDDYVARGIINLSFACPISLWNYHLIRLCAVKSLVKKRYKVFELMIDAYSSILTKVRECGSTPGGTPGVASMNVMSDGGDGGSISSIYTSSVEVESFHSNDIGMILLYIAIRNGAFHTANYLLNKRVIRSTIYPSVLFQVNRTSDEFVGYNVGYVALLHEGIMRDDAAFFKVLLRDCVPFINPMYQATASSVSASSAYGSITKFNKNSPQHLYYFTPIAFACLIGNSTVILKALLNALPKSLTAKQCCSCPVSPIVACVLVGNINSLLLLEGHMGDDEFALACHTLDHSDMTPLHALLVLLLHQIDSKYNASICATISINHADITAVLDVLLKASARRKQQLHARGSTASPTTALSSITKRGDTITALNRRRIEYLGSKLCSDNNTLNAILDDLQDTLSCVCPHDNSVIFNSSRHASDSAISSSNVPKLKLFASIRSVMQTSYNSWRSFEYELKHNKFILGMKLLLKINDLQDRHLNRLAYCMLLILNATKQGVAVANTSKPMDKNREHQALLLLIQRIKGGSNASIQLSSQSMVDKSKRFSSELLKYSYTLSPSLNGNSSTATADDSSDTYRSISEDVWQHVYDQFGANADGCLSLYGDMTEQQYFSSIQLSSNRVGHKYSDYAINSIRILFKWMQCLIHDYRYIYSPSTAKHQHNLDYGIIQLGDAGYRVKLLQAVELDDVIHLTVNVITSIADQIGHQTKHNVDEGPPDSYIQLLRLLAWSHSSSTTMETYLSSLKSYISLAVNDSILPSSHPLATSLGVGDVARTVGAARNKYHTSDPISIAIDSISRVIDMRYDILSDPLAASIPDVSSSSCPLLILAARGMWTAAIALLNAWIDDGYDGMTHSFYLMSSAPTNAADKDDVYLWLSSCKREILSYHHHDTVDASAIFIDVRKATFVTPLHFAVYEQNTDFIAILLKHYPTYKYIADSITFAVQIDRVPIAFYILANATSLPPVATSKFSYQANCSTKGTGNTPASSYSSRNIKLPMSSIKFIQQVLDYHRVTYSHALIEGAIANHSSQYVPNTDGLYQGLLVSAADDTIVLMNGTCITKHAFHRNMDYLSKVLTIPMTSCGFNNTGTTILHKAVLFDACDDSRYSSNHSVDDICTALLSSSSKHTLIRSFAVDEYGCTPLYYALTQGNFTLAAKMMNNALQHCSRSNANITIDDLFYSHTSVPINIQVKQLFYPSAMRQLHGAQAAYHENIENKTQACRSSASLYMLTHALSRIDSVYQGIVGSNSLRFLKVSYAVPGAVLDSVRRARSILGLLGVDTAAIGDDGSVENLVNFQSVSPDLLRDLVTIDTARAITDSVTQWYHNRSSSTSTSTSGGSMSMKNRIVSDTLTLFHRWDVDCNTVGVHGYEAVVNRKRPSFATSASGANDGCIDGAGERLLIHMNTRDGLKLLTSQLMYEISSRSNDVRYAGVGVGVGVGGEPVASEARLDCKVTSYRTMEAFLLSVDYNVQTVQDSLQAAYLVIDLGRWIAMARLLVSMTTDNTCAATSTYSAITGNRNVHLSHPLDTVYRNLNRAKQYEHKVVQAVSTAQYYRDCYDCYQHGLSKRLTICDDLTVDDVKAMLCMKKQLQSSRFSACLEATVAGLNAMAAVIGRVDLHQVIDGTLCTDTYNIQLLIDCVKSIRVSDVIDPATGIQTNAYAELSSICTKLSMAMTSSGTDGCSDDSIDGSIRVEDVAMLDTACSLTNRDALPVIIAEYFALMRGISVADTIEHYRVKCSSIIGLKVIKEKMKKEIASAYQAMNTLGSLIIAVDGIHKSSLLYYNDIKRKISSSLMSITDFYLALCCPRVFYGNAAASASPTAKIDSHIWLDPTEDSMADRMRCMTGLIELDNNDTKSNTMNFGHDMKSPVALSALYGNPVMLSYMLSVSRTAAKVYGELLWNVLMCMPPPSSSKHTLYEHCLRLLLDHDIPACKPLGAVYSCTDLAAVKSLPTDLILKIFLKESDTSSKSVPYSILNDLCFNAFHYSILRNMNDDLLLKELVGSNMVPSQQQQHNLMHPAFYEDVKIHCRYVLSHLPVHTSSNSMTGSDDSTDIISGTSKMHMLMSLSHFKSMVCKRRGCSIGQLFTRCMQQYWTKDCQSIAAMLECWPRWLTAFLSRTISVNNDTRCGSNSVSCIDIALSAGNYDMFVLLFRHYDSGTSDDVLSLLQYACFYQQNSCVVYALNHHNDKVAASEGDRLTDSSKYFAPMSAVCTLVEVCMFYSNFATLEYLLQLGAVVSMELLLKYIHCGKLSELNTLLLLKHIPISVAIEEQQICVQQLVHACSIRGFHKVIIELSNMGADCDTIDQVTGLTPMMSSIALGHRYVTNALSTLIIHNDTFSVIDCNRYIHAAAVIKYFVRLYLHRKSYKCI